MLQFSVKLHDYEKNLQKYVNNLCLSLTQTQL